MRALALLLAAGLGWSAPAPQKPLLIVATGDSTTAGTPYFRSPLEAPPNGQGNSQGQYAYWVMKRHPKWRVVNNGINGQRSDEVGGRFEDNVLKVKPDYAVILAGVNDVGQGYPIDMTLSNLMWMYTHARDLGITPIAASVLPFTRATPAQSKKINVLNTLIKKQAQYEKVAFCDFNKAVADPKNPDRLKGSPDGLHPDVAGYRAMGEALGRLIEELEAKKSP